MPLPKVSRVKKRPVLTPEANRYLRHSQDNLNGPGAKWHPNGSPSTVFGTIIGGEGGEKARLVPTVWDGQILEGDALFSRLRKEGGKWPEFNTINEALEYESFLKEEHINKQKPQSPEAYHRLVKALMRGQ